MYDNRDDLSGCIEFVKMFGLFLILFGIALGIMLWLGIV